MLTITLIFLNVLLGCLATPNSNHELDWYVIYLKQPGEPKRIGIPEEYKRDLERAVVSANGTKVYFVGVKTVTGKNTSVAYSYMIDFE